METKKKKYLSGQIPVCVFYLCLGACLVFLPVETVNVLCKIVFGLVLIGAGIYHISIFVLEKDNATILDLFSGVVVFVLGTFLFQNPQIVRKLLTLMFGALLLVDCIWTLRGSLKLKKRNRGLWKAFLAESLIFVLLGVLILVNPFSEMKWIISVSGWSFLLNGCLDIVFYILLRRDEKKTVITEEAGAEADKEAEEEEEEEENGAEEDWETEPHEAVKEECKMVLLNFTGVYQEEQFWKEKTVLQIDLQDLSGTNCYCDEDAQKEIKKRLENVPAGGICFLDSGNYHYMSRILAEKINEPFRMLVFDNHTDMQRPAFGGLLSCGGWIANALEEIPNLKEVWLVGPDEEAYSQVESCFWEKVHFLSREKLGTLTSWIQELPADLPLYLSIDKDVLGTEDAATTWSQGEMILSQLLDVLDAVCEKQKKEGGRILQVDICGECDPKELTGNEKNDHANELLWKFFSETEVLSGKSEANV